MIAVLTFLIMTTLFRYEIFYNIAVAISWATNDPKRRDDLVQGAADRIMIYISKITPLAIVLFVHTIIRFFAKEAKEDK